MRRIDLRALALDAATTEPGMLGVNPEKARALAKTLERQGFQYRFPIEPPKPEIVRHGFVKYGLGEGEGREREWKILNERKNGYHNVTVLDAAAKDEMPRHKFQPMPPNTRGAKSGLCNKCLEHRSHTNHYIDDTKLEKMKDAIKPLNYHLSNTCTHCNGTGWVMNGGMRRDCGVCRGTGKLGYSYKVYDAETSCDPRDGKFTSGGGSKSTGNPRRFGSSGRGRVSPEAEKRFAEEMERGRKKPEAKDQVPQDCFDAQILGV